MKQLSDKIAVVYGNGPVGASIAKAFALAGAKVYLAGRTPAKLTSIKDEIASVGATIEIAVLDAVDSKAVEKHMADIIKKEGRIDISFNAIGIPQTGIQGISLIDLSESSFLQPITTYLRAHFITAKAAATRMIHQQGGGAILMHTPEAGHVSQPFVGGMIPAWAAMEAFNRSLSVEYGPQGLRTVCLMTSGIPETPLIDEVWQIHGKVHGISREQFHNMMESGTHRKRLTTLKELSAAAVFAASDEGSAITGTTFNLTAGMIV
jgi:NAD(P)-dependent dehydrogenase (short-subunit alcohol dehydrogenase family)